MKKNEEVIIAKGSEIELNNKTVKIHKVKRMPQMLKRGDKFSPTMRVYWKDSNRQQGHFDCEVPSDIEVVFG